MTYVNHHQLFQLQLLDVEVNGMKSWGISRSLVGDGMVIIVTKAAVISGDENAFDNTVLLLFTQNMCNAGLK